MNLEELTLSFCFLESQIGHYAVSLRCFEFGLDKCNRKSSLVLHITFCNNAFKNICTNLPGTLGPHNLQIFYLSFFVLKSQPEPYSSGFNFLLIFLVKSKENNYFIYSFLNADKLNLCPITSLFIPILSFYVNQNLVI